MPSKCQRSCYQVIRGGDSLVLQREETHIGDLGIAMLPSGEDPVYAVIGDTGPAAELGEGSIALNGKLLGKTAEPQNYYELIGRHPFGQGWTVARAFVLVFPGTRNNENPYMTGPRIDEAAKKRLEEWGGVTRLTACAKAYGRP